MIRTKQHERTDKEMEDQFLIDVYGYIPQLPPPPYCESHGPDKGGVRHERLTRERFTFAGITNSSNGLAEIMNKISSEGIIEELVVDPATEFNPNEIIVKKQYKPLRGYLAVYYKIEGKLPSWKKRKE